MKEVIWDDRFNCGVEAIDTAHQKLFSIMRRLIGLSTNEDKRQWACTEGLKYFKNYTIKHFQEEEAYMQTIGYEDYAIHKRLHDNLRYKVLPTLEQELEESNYSPEAIQHFFGFCTGWLTGHILVDDFAITGKIKSKWRHNPNEEELADLEKSIIQAIHAVFQTDAKLISDHYMGEPFGKAIYYRLSYRSQKDNIVHVVLVFEEQLILRTVGWMLYLEKPVMDKLLLAAAKQLSSFLVKRIGMPFESEDRYRLDKESQMSNTTFLKLLDRAYPNYSLLFQTSLGYFAFCLYR